MNNRLHQHNEIVIRAVEIHSVVALLFDIVHTIDRYAFPMSFDFARKVAEVQRHL